MTQFKMLILIVGFRVIISKAKVELLLVRNIYFKYSIVLV
jgi:hypothetical protein